MEGGSLSGISCNFYPRSPCGERHKRCKAQVRNLLFLSTLSLRRATLNLPSSPIDKNISIHALLAESDGGFAVGNWPLAIFLSTLSLRRATAVTTVVVGPSRDFYPRSPCGERRQWRRSVKLFRQFLSTLSLRRATVASLLATGRSRYFYPRSPCGERRRTKTVAAEVGDFYPRSPCGERPDGSH